ncbi:MAG: serine/threonine protein kinase [Myxococcales bacterium]|nr:serine/threonine protein kinase [Myxococcales bacterium]
MQVDASLVGRMIGGKYRVEQLVGQGGCGVVVRAVHRGLGQAVAIKLLKAPLAARDDVARRFVREAQALARLTSEHTVRAVDVGVEPGLGPYIVMEWLDGMTLAQALATGPVGVPAAVDYALQICAALAEAHRVGLIHRDIKPSNLFLTRRTDGRPLLKVMDFGIAKWTGAGGAMTAPDVVLGSPGYLAPEQARDARSVDARADIWAVGAVLYEMICGQRLRGGAAGADPGDQRLLGTAMPLPAWVPPALRATIERCLVADPAARYSHVADLAVFASPAAAALAPEIARIAHAPRGAPRGRVDLAPTLDLVRPRPAAPPRRARWPRRAAPWVIALAAVAAAMLVIGRTSGSPPHRGSLARACASSAADRDPTAATTGRATTTSHPSTPASGRRNATSDRAATFPHEAGPPRGARPSADPPGRPAARGPRRRRR